MKSTVRHVGVGENFVNRFDRRGRCVALAMSVASAVAMTAHAEEPTRQPSNPATAIELPKVSVIGTTPLPGLGMPLSHVPANVQSANAADIERQQTLDVVDFMNQNLNGVNVNETQDNPFQIDVNFRGFTASPLLGTPQGLSVYVDGVRVNESFGDVVNWDLIPESAIATLSLMPGSNPTFGLNTLGGALSIQTKSGKQFPGTQIEGYGGSFGRRAAEFETGGAFGKGFDYFLTGNYLDEDGWRDASPSHVRQLFGKVGWEDEKTDVDVSYAWADNNLVGNGFLPESMLAYRRESAFTVPDQTVNHFNFIDAHASHFLGDDLLLAGNAYFRQLSTLTFNGDANDDYSDDYEAAVAPGGLCDGAGDPDACAAAALADETGANHTSHTDQRRWGATLQLTYTGHVFGRDNSFTTGASHDDGRSDFVQSQQQAALTADRATTTTGPVEPLTSLYGTDRATGLYVTDTFSPNRLLHFTASARYNGSRIDLNDRLGSDLNGQHVYYRINPAFGGTFTPSRNLTIYADYNEGSRTPTPIELGCANPEIPCQLPNALASDPDLKQVVARTVEMGARGDFLGKKLGWSAALFHTLSADDIQFIASSITGAGYFSNVGTTRRRGAELGLYGEAGRLTWRANYSFVDATYRSPFSLVAADNSTADANGFITVEPGNRIPLIPRHTGRLVAEYVVTPHWSTGANLILSSGQYLLENNNNQSQAGTNADGVFFQGSGRTGGYAVLNLNSSWEFLHGWTLFGRLNNVFDRNYATAGSLGQNPFTPDGRYRSNPDDWTEENAVSPAAPRAVWAGLRVRLN
jgi:outer membrane receptor protein involved in Fe transport